MKILATDMDGTFLDHLGAYDKARLGKAKEIRENMVFYLQIHHFSCIITVVQE